MGARILVIEDHPDSLELVCFLLRSFGHQPIGAATGAEGLRQAREQAPDLVLCDLQLPDIGGLEVARQLRELPGLASVPLIAVTAFARASDRERVLAANFEGYFSKPIDPEHFVEEVEAFLDPRRGDAADSGAPA